MPHRNKFEPKIRRVDSEPAHFPRPKKSFGQNFLKDQRVVERIVQALAPRPDETIIEIGPGHGALTEQLVERAGRVLAIEFDHDLAPLLRDRFSAHERFELIEADALQVDYCRVIVPDTRARLVANLPYNISTAILQHLVSQRACVSEMVLMLQREVVARVAAEPGGRERGYLSVLVEAYFDAETLFDVSPAAFHPVPKVWSTVVRLRSRPVPRIDIADDELFRSIVSAGFAQRRKTILNNLRHAPQTLQEVFERAGGVVRLLEHVGLEPQRRAETLSLEEWGTLAATVSKTV